MREDDSFCLSVGSPSKPVLQNHPSTVNTATTSPCVPSPVDTAITSPCVPSPVDTATTSPCIPSPVDIATYASDPVRVASLTDEVKYTLISQRKPESSFKYPKTKFTDTRRKEGASFRGCNSEWLDKYEFLSYSKSKDGLYCLSCVLFATQSGQSGNAQSMVETPYSSWKYCLRSVAKHSNLMYHKRNAAKMSAFLATHNNQKQRIDFSISAVEKERVARNRVYISSILKCLEFCGRQGLALRGHRDDSTSDSLSQGNFKALIDFCIEAGDQDLQHHLETCQKNATYISKTSQNELLVCVKEHIQGEIVKEIKNQDLGVNFAVLADEVSDVSNWEQLGLVLRYVKDGKPVEKLVEFIPCESITGEAIHAKIKESLHQLALDQADCRAQGYDGAGNMAGRLKGCAARFTQEVPRAIYFHCASHQLNLALSAACRMPEIQCAMSTLKAVGLFYKYSPKRQRELEKSVQLANSERSAEEEPLISKTKIKMLCETRWVERHTVLEDFDEMYAAILDCLDNIASPRQRETDPNWDSKSITEGSGLYTAITAPAFIATFQSVRFLFGFTKDLSVLLQGSAKDILSAYEDISLVTEELKSIRENVEKEFPPIFQKMLTMANVSGHEDITIPRRCGKQTYRSNVEADSPEVYWRRSTFLPFLDFLISELRSRFDQMTSTAVMGLSFIPSHLPTLTDDMTSKVHSFYLPDLPSPATFHQEVRLWKRKWEGLEQDQALPTDLQDTLSVANHHLFPNICRILYFSSPLSQQHKLRDQTLLLSTSNHPSEAVWVQIG